MTDASVEDFSVIERLVAQLDPDMRRRLIESWLVSFIFSTSPVGPPWTFPALGRRSGRAQLSQPAYLLPIQKKKA